MEQQQDACLWHCELSLREAPWMGPCLLARLLIVAHEQYAAAEVAYTRTERGQLCCWI
jgi:hypothetical protein